MWVRKSRARAGGAGIELFPFGTVIFLNPASPASDSLCRSARRPIENENVTQYLIRFANGAVGTIGSSGVGTGRKLGLDYEIQGTKGALRFTQ